SARAIKAAYSPTLPAGPPLVISTAAPGRSRSGGPTARHPSERLSDVLAAATGSTPSGKATSMCSAYGTRTRSANRPPHSPPAAPTPYIEVRGTLVQFAVSPRRQNTHVPHEI